MTEKIDPAVVAVFNLAIAVVRDCVKFAVDGQIVAVALGSLKVEASPTK